MKFSKRVVFFMFALFLCIGATTSFSATVQNPPMQSALWKELDKRDSDGGYEEVFALIDKLVFSDQFPDKDDKNVIRLWLRIHLRNNPQYGLSYARLHLEEALVQRNYNTPAHREAIGTAVMSFYTSSLLLQSDLASCADETAGQALKASLKKEERKYRRHYNELDPMLQPIIIRAIERSRDNSKTRRPDTERCKSGEAYMQQSVGGDQYTIQPDENGSKIVHEETQGVTPELVSDEEWQKRREALYRDTLESLK